MPSAGKKATAADALIPFLDLQAPHRELREELLNAFQQALASAAFVGGPEVSAFEREFAGFVGTEGCVAVSSGTDALRFAYQAMDIAPGDEVITVPNTFIATTEALTQAGAAIRFVDVEPETLTINPEAIESAISQRTVGIVPVHLYGQSADMAPILATASKHGLWIVEDAAQAHGAEYKGRRTGTMGTLAAFSFYPGKNLGALGEAGATVGSESARLKRIRQLRDHGQSRKYYHDSEGYNGRLDAIQAAFLRIKLRHLERWNEQRRKVAAWYRSALHACEGVQIPVEAAYSRHVYHLYVIQAERRDELQKFLETQEISTGLHYPRPLHLQDAYGAMNLSRGAFPVAEAAADKILSLPMYPELTEAQVGRIASAIRRFYRG